MTMTKRPRRRLLALVLGVVVLAAAATATALAQGQRFTDVPPDHEAYEAVEWMAEAGVTVGYDDGTFKPERPLPKQHAVVFVERFYDDVLGAEESPDFTRGDFARLLHGIAQPGGTSPAATTTVPPTTTTAAPASTGNWEGVSGTLQGINPAPYTAIGVEERVNLWDHSSSLGDDEAYLLVRCIAGATDFIIVWDGLVFGDVDNRVTMEYRLDDGPVERATAYEASRSDTTFIHAPEPQALEGHDSFTVQTYDWYDGEAGKGVTFDISGYAAARDKWLTNCGSSVG